MKPDRFPLSSDLMELLLAFEERKGLEALASFMGRDVSVISRNLQRMAELLPVLEKRNRRWEITPLGKKVNALTRRFLEEMAEATSVAGQGDRANRLPSSTTLLVINAQAGLLGAGLNQRGHRDAEQNIEAIIQAWRNQGRPVVWIKHVSESPDSRFYRGSPGAEFLPHLAPGLRAHHRKKAVERLRGYIAHCRTPGSGCGKASPHRFYRQ